MQKPSLPENETQRIETLNSLNVLDTAPEERFDRLTRMAKRMFNVPIALVSLVDENRQWFKSCVGLPVLETPRDISFCGHAILGDEIFVIPDTAVDERFSDNPLVTDEPFIRFYAGCPLTMANGNKIGTLCIIDRQPRYLTSDDFDCLKDLAKTVEQELMAIELATIDELTNVANRRGLKLVANHNLKLCLREQIPATVLFFDLDKFKPINDQYGHAEGDKILKIFVEQLQAVARDSDLIARLGGDEFVALLINTTHKQAEKLLDRLSSNIESFNQANNLPYKLAFSCGAVEYDPQTPEDIDSILKKADELMYQSKRN